MKRTTLLVTTLLASLALAGCAAPASDVDAAVSPAAYVVAFSVKDDYQKFVSQTQPLADWLTAKTGVPTTVLPVADESASIAALASGQAHAAFMDAGAAWVGWTSFDLQAIAADTDSNGATSYTATAWTRSNADIESLEDLRGVRSCHTGELKSAGMLVPMGHLIGQGLISTDGLDMDDIASLEKARERFFSGSTIGGGYNGALQCLSTGVGDVAFIKTSTWDDYCTGDKAETWCLPRDQYQTLPEGGFAQVPSHPVMVSKTLPAADRENLQTALLALNDDAQGKTILKDILNTDGIKAVTTQEHLGSYGDALEHVPGIRAYLQGKQYS